MIGGEHLGNVSDRWPRSPFSHASKSFWWFSVGACALMSAMASIAFYCEGVLDNDVELLRRLFGWTFLAVTHTSSHDGCRLLARCSVWRSPPVSVRT